jgi:hypothetical protein
MENENGARQHESDESVAMRAMQPEPEQQPALPMREEYPTFGVSIADTEDGGRALIIQVPYPRKTMILPFTAENAVAVGQKLSAPRVVVADRVPPTG